MDIKRYILSFLAGCIMISCFSIPGYPMTAFIVKNTSNKPISFSASVIKFSQTFGAQEITNPFTVRPHDSIIVRQTYFKKDGENPQNWFSKFSIFPIDGIKFNDPERAENWVKGEKDKIPTYTFTLNQ